MSDIGSPMVILLENEADAFWCFERAMRRLVCSDVFSSLCLIVIVFCIYILA